MPRKIREERNKYAREYYALYPEKRRPYKDRVAYFKQYHSEKENKERERVGQLRRKYGITNEEYDEMFKKQDGRCLVCGETSDKVLCVDHDHKTGRVRGLLCYRCNTALGHLRDDPEIIMKLYEYMLS